MIQKGIEAKRLAVANTYDNWKKWGPYLAERQWGTVREDYSSNGDTWNFISHEKARSNAYRWGEEGIAGFTDAKELLCLAPAFWNGKDTILKERLFGLTNNQGNHGEDVKELYFHQISSPTHSYSKYLYKYPHGPFPYDELVRNNQRSRDEFEFEILDTDAFKDNAYFDCFIEYAKADVDDILMQVTIINRGKKAAPIHVLPHLWFRNFWKHNTHHSRASITSVSPDCSRTKSKRNGNYYFYNESGEQLFCDNETNNKLIYNVKNEVPYVKDGINNHVVNGKPTVNPKKKGSKMAVWHKFTLKAGEEKTIKVRLSKIKLDDPWGDFDAIFQDRISECETFYNETIKSDIPETHQAIAKSAFSGLLWTKQFYYYDVFKWLFGGPGEANPNRKDMRNYNWKHLTNRHVISMPDKWEYPWYAAWDLAFHMASFVEIDPFFAKEQLLLVLKDNYMHPNGQIPAYEWNFSDVNPPVHSYFVWNVYEKDKKNTGKGDTVFLEKAFQKLLLNFTWWVNQKDKNGTDLFEGGFLGLDNIGVFDRNHMPPNKIIRTRPDLASLITNLNAPNENGDFLFALMRGFRLEHLLKRLLDEEEFLSEYGIRSLSKYHEKHPFVFQHHGHHQIQYELFETNGEGKFQYHADNAGKHFTKDKHFKDLHLFYEFFDGDNGKGLGASHQTGWTALIANLIMEMDDDKA